MYRSNSLCSTVQADNEKSDNTQLHFCSPVANCLHHDQPPHSEFRISKFIRLKGSLSVSRDKLVTRPILHAAHTYKALPNVWVP